MATIPHPNWTEAVARISTAALALPVEIDSEGCRQSLYTEWLGTAGCCNPLRTTSPVRYQAIVDHLRSFIVTTGRRL